MSDFYLIAAAIGFAAILLFVCIALTLATASIEDARDEHADLHGVGGAFDIHHGSVTK